MKTTLQTDALAALKFCGINTNQLPDITWVKSIPDSTKVSIAVTNISETKGTVPDVRGMGLKDAVYVLENAGLKVNVLGYGTVQTQSITPGTKSAEGLTIQLMMN